MRVPQVVNGPRGAGEVFNLEPTQKDETLTDNQLRAAIKESQKAHRDATRKALQAAKDKTGRIVFQSRYHQHRIQVLAPHDSVNPMTGGVIRSRSVAAQFHEGIYILDMEKEEQTQSGQGAYIYKHLTNHPNFGLNRDFWLAAEAYEEERENRYSQTLELIKSDPEIAQRLKADLAAFDFEMPEIQTSQEIADAASDEGIDALVAKVEADNRKEKKDRERAAKEARVAPREARSRDKKKKLRDRVARPKAGDPVLDLDREE